MGAEPPTGGKMAPMPHLLPPLEDALIDFIVQLYLLQNVIVYMFATSK